MSKTNDKLRKNNPDNIYKYDHENKMYRANLLNQMHQGETVSEILAVREEYAQMVVDRNTELDEQKRSIQLFLMNKGVECNCDSFEEVVQHLYELPVVHKTNLNMIVEEDEYGYINRIDSFLEQEFLISEQHLPVDILDGYYKIESGRIVLDESRKEELYSLD